MRAYLYAGFSSGNLCRKKRQRGGAALKKGNYGQRLSLNSLVSGQEEGNEVMGEVGKTLGGGGDRDVMIYDGHGWGKGGADRHCASDSLIHSYSSSLAAIYNHLLSAGTPPAIPYISFLLCLSAWQTRENMNLTTRVCMQLKDSSLL